MRFFPTVAGKKLADFKSQWESFNRSVYKLACQANSSAPIVQMYKVNTFLINHLFLILFSVEAISPINQRNA